MFRCVLPPRSEQAASISAMRGSEVVEETSMVELAVVEEDVRIGVGRDRKRALADAGTDQGPGLALAVPEADPTVAKVVRRPCWCAGRLAGAGDHRPQSLLGQAREHGL